MTEQEIREGAPSEAEFYRIEWNSKPLYYRNTKGYLEFYSEGLKAWSISGAAYGDADIFNDLKPL